VNDIAAAEGVSSTVTHLVYTHHHSDHAGASSLFGSNEVRIGHDETRRLLSQDNDPAKPAPEETFADHRTLEIGGERIQLAWHGSNHSPDNTYIHFPDHDPLLDAGPDVQPSCGIRDAEKIRERCLAADSGCGNDLAGLPPARVTAYQFDPTRDEVLNYARLLIQAGVPCDLHH